MNRTLYWYIEELSGTKKDGDCLNFMAIQFDPIDYMQQLEAAGVSKAEAEVHARALGHLVGNCVALPGDLARLEHDLRREIKALEERINAKLVALEERINAKLVALEERINAKLVGLEQRLTARIDTLEAKIDGQIMQLRWMFATLVATNIAIVVKLFIP